MECKETLLTINRAIAPNRRAESFEPLLGEQSLKPTLLRFFSPFERNQMCEARALTLIKKENSTLPR